MKKLKLLFLIIWMTIIFLFSNQPALESTNLSNSIINKTIIKIYESINGNISEEKKEQIIKKTFYPIRKLAHFTEYFILGVLIFFVFKDYIKLKHIIIFSIIFCFVYACSDEFHQYFVIGRNCSIFDVLIDSFGSMLSILLSYKICKNNKNMYNI